MTNICPATISLPKEFPALKASIFDAFCRPLSDLRISVTQRCNLHCHYCKTDNCSHVSGADSYLSFDQITRFARVSAQLGVSKIRITGGEPLLRSNLEILVAQLAAIPGIDDLALTTNGILLQPQLSALKNAGLRRLTISLDSLNPGRYPAKFHQQKYLRDVLAAIQTATQLGFDSVKINVVIIRGYNEDEVLTLAGYFRGTGHILRFIEYMDVGEGKGWSTEKVLPSKDILKLINSHFPLEPLLPNRFGEVAERYRYCDGSGEVGFISSISQPFCRTCTRLRLTADGKILPCLFSGRTRDVRSLLAAQASDHEIASVIKEFWKSRTDKYSEYRAQGETKNSATKKFAMYEIGG